MKLLVNVGMENEIDAVAKRVNKDIKHFCYHHILILAKIQPSSINLGLMHQEVQEIQGKRTLEINGLDEKVSVQKVILPCIIYSKTHQVSVLYY